MNRLASVALVVVALAGCGKKNESSGNNKPTAAAPAPTPTPTPPPAPAAPVFSPDAAKALVTEMAACSTDFGCKAYDTLVGFGAQAAPAVLVLAGDATATEDARRIAASALTKIKAPDQGAKLIEIANAVTDASGLQGDLYEAAGAGGGKPVFDALIAEYIKADASTDDDREIPLRSGLKAFPADSVAWAAANIGKLKGADVGCADLITDSAQAADLPAIQAMLGATKDPMAKHRLAAKAIALGDPAHFDVFIAGLKSKDEYDRSDAANFLEDIADQAPAELKAELIDLLQKGKAADRGGMTAMGYDKALKKLGQ